MLRLKFSDKIPCFSWIRKHQVVLSDVTLFEHGAVLAQTTQMTYTSCFMTWQWILWLLSRKPRLRPNFTAHPLYPIDNRSRNKRRNLWVGWCVSPWWPWFPSRSSLSLYIYTYIYIYAFLIWVLLYDVYIYTTGVSFSIGEAAPPSRSIGLYFWGVRGSWPECHFLFSLVYQLCLALW